MGGKAAKERRRLARLAANGKVGDDKQPTLSTAAARKPSSKTAIQDNKNDSQRKEQKYSPRPSRSPIRRQGGDNHDSHRTPNPKLHNKRQGERRRPVQEPKKTKSKIKKPKHLKRKIEKLSAEGAEEQRQKLLNEMNEFEARKSAMAKPKRQKPNAPVAIPCPSPGVQQSVVVESYGQISEETPQQGQMTVDSLKSAPTAESAIGAEEPAEKKEKNTVDNAREDESGSDSDVSLKDATRRQRGRRRRGRKSTDEQTKALQDSQPIDSETKKTRVKTQIPSNNSAEVPDSEPKSDPTKKTKKKDDKRRCIGRKPVIDFMIGQRYSGKVVYTKPFGAFIDIGCHSDAFCHVSRVQDDFVESIDDALSIGQEVSARVVEVDRKAKRITVSLQSDARIDDERASVKARRERKEKQAKGEPSSATSVLSDTGNNESAHVVTPVQTQHNAPAPVPPMNESTMTPAELKRARKLARRAARREQKAQTGIAA